MPMVDALSLETGLRILVPAIYLLVVVGYVAEFIRNRTSHFSWTVPVLVTGIFFHIVFFISLYVNHYTLPYDTVFRGLLFVGLLVSVLYLGMEHLLGEIRYGALLFPLIFVITAVGAAGMNSADSLPKPLHSIYFVIHTSALFLAYACFLLSFVISCMYQMQYREIRNHRLGGLFKRLPALADMDRAVARVDALGLSLLIIGIAGGFLWMEIGLGQPVRLALKIALTGLTATVYLTEHLLRIGKGWDGQRACTISIVGFLFVIITLLAGRHGY
jgi:ABC-type uncharacterized transport system permease subunit